MIGRLDDLIGYLRHQEQRADTYRLVRPTFTRGSDAHHWLMAQPSFRTSRDSERSRRLALGTWIWLRHRHHTAWVERGGSE
jgi:hypothetical protein